MADVSPDKVARVVRDFDRVTRFRSLAASTTSTLNLTTPKTLVLVDTSGGNRTLTLPDPLQHPGHVCVIKKMTAANTLSIAGTGAELPKNLTTQYDALNFTSVDGSWHIW